MFNKFSFYNLLIIVNHAIYLLAKSTFVTLESISPLLSWMIFLVTMNLLFYICMWMQCVHDLFMSMCVSVDAHMPHHGNHRTPQEPCSLTSTLVQADCSLFTPEDTRLVHSQAPISVCDSTIETLAHSRHRSPTIQALQGFQGSELKCYNYTSSILPTGPSPQPMEPLPNQTFLETIRTTL